jgi:shikimate kinase
LAEARTTELRTPDVRTMGHVFLIGFMCSGKSTVGRALAPMLGLPFTDLDRQVEARVGPLLPFIREHGEEAFRGEEAAALQALADTPRMVVATGGGTPMAEGHMAFMRAHGRVVWLDVPLPVLMPRIERAGGDRPLLYGLTGEALLDRVQGLLADRAATYAQAHVRIDGSGPPDVVAGRIAEALRGQLM